MTEAAKEPFSLDDGNWIPLFRQIRDHWTWKHKPFAKGQAWTDLLLRANYHESTMPFRAAILKVGPREVACTVDGLAKAWGWHHEKVTMFLNALELEGAIARKFMTFDPLQGVWAARKTASGIMLLTIVRMPIRSEKPRGTTPGTREEPARNPRHPRIKDSEDGKNSDPATPEVVPDPAEEGATGGGVVQVRLAKFPALSRDPKLCRRLPELEAAWATSCPDVDVDAEMGSANAWLIENPHKAKKDIPRFLGGWMRRAQEKIREKAEAVKSAGERKDYGPPKIN